MSQFGAVLIDALRLLRARALFWVTLAISALVALIYLSIGFDEEGVSVFFGMFSIGMPVATAGSPEAEALYLDIFTRVLVNVWLAWIAVGLALITCAPMFPDFMAEGSAGAVLCKPISRLRLFLYKYVSGLLFALLQTLVFCVIVFAAVRWRIGIWKPEVFWAVPLIVLMFSYLWAVMVAVGVRTRSVMASVLAAVLVWFLAWTASIAETLAWTMAGGGLGSGAPAHEEVDAQWKEWYPIVSVPYKILPKTSDTVNLLRRAVNEDVEIPPSSELGEAIREEDEAAKRNSPAFIIGTSLAFELVVMGLGAWIFCRRDF